MSRNWKQNIFRPKNVFSVIRNKQLPNCLSHVEFARGRLKVSEYCPPGQYEIPQNNFVSCLSYSHYKLINYSTNHAASFNNAAGKQTFSFKNQDYQVSANSADTDQTLTLANSEDPDQRSLIRTFFVVCCTLSSILSGLESRSLGLNTLGTT